MKTKLVMLLVVVVAVSFAVAACQPTASPVTQATSTPSIGSPTLKPASSSTAAVVSQEQKWNDIVKGAAQEGAVTVYSGAGPAVSDVITRAMKEKYGIQAQFVAGLTSEIDAKVMAERKANLYLADAIIVGGGNLVSDLKPAGALTPLQPFLVLPEVTDTKAWPGGKLPFYDKNNMSTPLTGAYWSYVLVNSDLVPDGTIKSYQDLLQPQWKGKIVMFDPTQGGPGKTMCTYFLAYIFGYEKGEAFLQNLVKQEPTVLKDARQLVEWVAQGKYPVGLAASMAVVPTFKTAGAPVKWIRVSEGGLVSPAASIFSVADKAPHPNAVTVLTNWLLTAEGQAAISKAYGQPATRLGIPSTTDPFQSVVPGEKVYYDDEDFYAQWDKATPAISRVFAPILK